MVNVSSTEQQLHCKICSVTFDTLECQSQIFFIIKLWKIIMVRLYRLFSVYILFRTNSCLGQLCQNTLIVGACTTSSGGLFHICTTLFIKKHFPKFNLEYFTKILWLSIYPLVLALVTTRRLALPQCHIVHH